MKATDILMNEHQNILLVLERMGVLLRKPLEENIVELEFILEFVKDYSDEYHHKKEENIYFEWIGTHSPGLKSGPVSCMLSEHATFRDLTSNAGNALKVFKAEGVENAREAVISSLQTFASLLESHIEKEDTMLYQMAERLDLQINCGDEQMLRQYEEVEKQLLPNIRRYNDYCNELRSNI